MHTPRSHSVHLGGRDSVRVLWITRGSHLDPIWLPCGSAGDGDEGVIRIWWTRDECCNEMHTPRSHSVLVGGRVAVRVLWITRVYDLGPMWVPCGSAGEDGVGAAERVPEVVLAEGLRL